MNKCPIGILDSGIGGISILNKVVNHLPNENYIYYADSIHNPYGNKNKEELIQIVDQIMIIFIQKKVKLVIVACNTASTQVISYLREKYPNILFVAVEPAIKVAYDNFPDKNVLVMATPGTIHSDRLMLLDKKYHQEQRTLLPCDGLAQLIENQKLEEIPIYLEKIFESIEKQKIEVIVLGCTHYPFIQKEIEAAIGHSVIFIDGSKGVKNRVEYLLQENEIQDMENKQGNITVLLTKESTKEIIDMFGKLLAII